MDSENNNQYIPFKERGDLWKDIEPLEQFTENVEILQIDYDSRFKEINDYFRAILQKNEISKRAFDLTTETIEVIK
jgi:protein farnesyltransferase/geranylgeranyltransferase type-1 subunit alpha